jgi:hypothetical protein
VWGQDQYFDQTTLLLHGDGTNGAQNNTFLDGSTNNFTITRNGNTTQGTFSPFSLAAGEWSNFFDGTGDYLSVADNAAFDLAASDFTFECWVYTTAYNSQYNCLISQWDTSLAYRFFFTSTTTTFGYYSGSSQTLEVTGQTNNLNEWIHFCVTRSGNTLTIYKNGTSIGTKDITGVTINNASVPLWISGLGTGSGSINNTTTHFGYISNLRLVKGTATAPPAGGPTSPLTNVTNTSLLTCQSNRFVDNGTANSGTGFTITRNGDVRVTPFSPFAPSAAYDPAVNGGSGYFDGTGDNLTVANNAAFQLGSGDFTIEFWAYFNSVAVGHTPLSMWATNQYQFSFYTSSAGVLSYYLSSNGTTWGIANGVSCGSISANQWIHVALVRSGSTFTPYINGVAGTTTTSASALHNSTAAVSAGSGSSVDYFNGYLSNVRIVKGTAITPPVGGPTAPLTPITNTSLLLNFTNAGIFDNTGKNALETVGNAQIDTAVVKYGTGSMEFDGSGDYLFFNGGENFAFGTGDFTIEFWYYSNNTGVQHNIYDSRPASTNGAYAAIFKDTSNLINYFVNGTPAKITSTTSIAQNTWYHIAVTRSGTSTKLFINGTQEGSTYTDSTNYLNPANRPVIGAGGFTLGNTPINGFIDDLRITKGIARYTANFVPPIARFPNQ